MMYSKLFKTIFLFVLSSANNLVFAQVGINQNTPKTSLDLAKSSVQTQADGLTIPRLTGNELKAKDNNYTFEQNSALVYVTAAPTTTSTKTMYVTSPNFYYYHAGLEKWMVYNHPKFFFMPSVTFDTTTTGTKEKDLYQLYYDQHTSPQKFNPSALGKVPVLGRTDLEYFITYYDTTVFSNLSITNDGKLTYTIINNATDSTFLNIVFVVK